MTAGASTSKRKAGPRCPICREPTVKAHRPFCSKRCANVDLGRWLKGAYAVPGDPVDEARDIAHSLRREHDDDGA